MSTKIIIDYNNNLSLIETLSKYNDFKYLNNFKLIMEKLNKIQVLKSNKYNICFPTESEINKLLYYEKKNDTSQLINLLMRLIKPIKSSFKLIDGNMIIIKLNNGTKCYIRTIMLEKNIKEIINNNNLTTISDIYTAYKKQYNYINDNYILFNVNVIDDDILNIFNELLIINKNIINYILIDKNVILNNINNGDIVELNKIDYINENKLKKNYDSDSDNDNIINDFSLNIENRIDIFNKFIENLKKTNNPDAYVNKILYDLKNVSKMNIFNDLCDDDSKKKKKKLFIYFLYNYNL